MTGDGFLSCHERFVDGNPMQYCGADGAGKYAVLGKKLFGKINEGKEKVGTALVHEDKVIHMAFFALAESEKIGRMAGMSQRRRNRTR